MRHTLSVLVENKPGVLTRIAGLFGRRAFNIDSLTVAETERPGCSRMTIVTRGDRHVMEQIEKQLYKLINVIKVTTLSKGSPVERELCLIKVHADVATRPAVTQIVDIFRARIVDVAPRSLVIEATGDRDKLEAIIANLRQFGIKEIIRSGPVAMARGAAALSAPVGARTGFAGDASEDAEADAGEPVSVANANGGPKS